MGPPRPAALGGYRLRDVTPQLVDNLRVDLDTAGVGAATARRRCSCSKGSCACADLAEWRLACGRSPASALLFPSGNGDSWREHDFRDWRKRAFRPAAQAAGLTGARPYDLRHSFVSLLINEGVSIVEVARQAGHSPEECLRTYAHVFEEFDPAERLPAEEAIRAARTRLVPRTRHQKER